MKDNRIELHNKLKRLLVESGGGLAKDVYFQQPENIKMSYPAIVYEVDGVQEKKSNNNTYFAIKRYSVEFMTRNPDKSLIDKFLQEFKFCSFSRSFESNNLNHYIFTIYY